MPSNAVIQSASLTLDVVIVPGGGGVDSTYDLHRVLVDWGEGVGTSNLGSAANPGEATWNNRFAPDTPWTTPGSGASNDFSAPITASQFIGNEGSYLFGSTSNLIADVGQWLTNPGTNFGWILISESENTMFTARRFGSRESTNTMPLLTVEYTLPSAPAIQSIVATNQQIYLSFLASSGQPYAMQYITSLTSTNWLTLTNIAAQLATTNVIAVDPFPTNARRFYRIVTQF
ncbi:MAG: hypothetical protein JWR19_3226 [Pedosphaera sp.]|nr:hypothetical protein [Pedosphaera sp.]